MTTVLKVIWNAPRWIAATALALAAFALAFSAAALARLAKWTAGAANWLMTGKEVRA